ncbi:MBL fold metallo-hydrolase [Brackiella oedipodis]|uniref:MBL fold metallo-hydrolase n=1 Tax=Brackiella oedipodis TaxID=124225 RepID=UPI00048E1649|nr:MBL fold metallo-hydrolase [Brackiella oedipodis]
MNKNEAKLHFPWQEQLPKPGHAITITEGLKWLRLPLPFALDHVNVWLLADEYQNRRGWTLIDCGINKPAVQALWQEIFDHVLEGLPIVRVIVTHMHPDHVGLAGWLCERWQAPLYMSMTDYFVARCMLMDPEGGVTGGNNAVRHFAAHGLRDPESLEKIRERARYYPGLVAPLPKSYHRLVDGEQLSIGQHTWRLIKGYGHAPEHMALYCADLDILISGDMLLPRISTNISVIDSDPEGNPLPLYLQTVKQFLEIPDHTLVLPSHGRPFKGIAERVKQQQEHHQERLDEVWQACQEQARSCAEIVPIMFKRQLDLHQLTFAMGEALAHLHALYFAGKLQRQQDAEGVYKFKAL